MTVERTGESTRVPDRLPQATATHRVSRKRLWRRSPIFHVSRNSLLEESEGIAASYLLPS
jgi:hypothetical protein